MRTLKLDLAKERRLNEILGQALELPAEEVEAFLQDLHHLQEDKQILAEVREMLAAEGHLGSFLEQPAGMALGALKDGALDGDAPLPNQVGPFRVLESLGEGGMGRVFLAEQTEPVRRQVALKLILTSLSGPEAAARFSAERQALARLSHPNIAQIYEAGTTEDGFPYFAMEYLPGVPVTEYCDAHRLSLDQRLKLFTTICRAVHHAHSKGIIHRDLKPSNLLVVEIDGHPIPKVIDFGIAKALDQPLTDATLHTAQRIIGTPAYMSPEALHLEDEYREDGGGDVDTRTDVYALGILLYELVASARPFETRGVSMAQVLRKIAEEDPKHPTTRFRSLSPEEQASIARRRRMDLRAFRQRLDSDLGWIVMKAIAKRRTDRYASASELAEEVERHLRDEPVLAGPPSVLYRTKKFARRNRWKLAAAAVALLLIATAIAIQVRASLRADDLARLSEQLGREVEGIEWVQRVAYQLPKQDVSAEQDRMRERMRRIEDRMEELGDSGAGPGYYALGRGALALQDLDSARHFLEEALEMGHHRPEVFLTLGLTFDALYQQRLQEIDLLSDSRERARLRQQAEENLRDPARAFLSRSGSAKTIAPELLEAHMAFFDGDWDLAEKKSQEARAHLPWLYEAAFLEGRVHRRRAGAAGRDNDLDTTLAHLLRAEEAVLTGLEIGRSDPRGYLQLCSLRALRLNLAVRYALPNPEATRDAALEACGDVRTVDPGNVNARIQEGAIWADWGDLQIWDLGEDPTDSLRRAKENLSGAIERDPLNANAWRLRGRSKVLASTYANRAGEDPRPFWEEGLEDLDHALTLAPNLHSARVLMSRVLGERAAYKLYRGEDPIEDLDRSVGLLHSTLELDENDERAWFYLTAALVFRADYRYQQGIDPMADLIEAASAAARALEIDPNLLGIHNNRANVELLKAKWQFKTGQDPTKALDQVLAGTQTALEKESSPAFPNLLMGQGHLEKARYLISQGEDPTEEIRKSRQANARGLSLLPRIPGAHLEMAWLALLEGQDRLHRGTSPLASIDKAEQRARTAMDIAPDRADTHRALGLASLLRAQWASRQGKSPDNAFAASRRGLEVALEMDPVDSENHLAFARFAWHQLDLAPPISLTEDERSTLAEEGLHHATEAMRLNPVQAEALAIQGALQSFNAPDSPESEALVLEALVLEAIRRNPNLHRQWQPWLDRHATSSP